MCSTTYFVKLTLLLFFAAGTICASKKIKGKTDTLVADYSSEIIDYAIACASGGIASYMLKSILEVCQMLTPTNWKTVPIYWIQLASTCLTIPLALKLVRATKRAFTMIGKYCIVQKIMTFLFVTATSYLFTYLGILSMTTIYSYLLMEKPVIPLILTQVINFFSSYYWQVIAISLVINVVGFGFGYFFYTDHFTDLSYALTFLTVTNFIYWKWDVHTKGLVGSGWIYIAITLWAMRLGGFLFMRIRHQKKDARFDSKRGSFVRFGAFWLLQAISVCIILFSTILFFQKVETSKNISYSLGWLILSMLGLLVETIADWQKYTFKKNPANQGKFIKSGLWYYSRHPNYLGEILFWLGIYLAQIPALENWEIIMGMITPMMITTLLVFVSGIPILEDRADARWGTDPSYQAYKDQTSGLVPFL
ncbi:MAG: DUF1295 domain-containing protein [Bacteroidota bacterium]